MTKRKKNARVHRRDAIRVRDLLTCPSLNEGMARRKAQIRNGTRFGESARAPLGAP
jgi:hypothetical protein